MALARLCLRNVSREPTAEFVCGMRMMDLRLLPMGDSTLGMGVARGPVAEIGGI